MEIQPSQTNKIITIWILGKNKFVHFSACHYPLLASAGTDTIERIL